MDTFLLGDFEVRNIADAPKNIGSVKININTLKYNTMTDALKEQSALFVRQYGTGGLATVSMRGMGAQHTAVMWNGINVNSCMNSNVDFNLIPLFLVDHASVETGANSAACGNGAIAGAIYLSNNIEKQNQVFANLQAGSFGYYQVGAGTVFNVKKVKLKTRLLYRKSENDIQYHNRFEAGSPMVRQVNSAFEQKGMLQEIEYRAGRYNIFDLSFWLLESDRELPAPMGVTNNANEKQYDLNNRLVITHRFRKSEKLAVNNKVAVIYDKLNYYNDYYPDALNISKSLIAESEWLYKVNKRNRFTASVNNNYSMARTDGYPDWPRKNLLSLWLKYEWQNRIENLLLSIGNRMLAVDSKLAPSSPDIAFRYDPFRFLRIKGNAAYSYRVPSFNDYFWLQGGNSNLKPERGFKQELSAEIKYGEFKFSATVFHHVVNDWIVWAQSNSGAYYMAQNARQIASKGFELSMDYTKKSGRHTFQFLSRYQYVESINTKVYDLDAAVLEKQLIYIPNHTAVATVNYRFKKFFCYFSEQFTGGRYTTFDNRPEYRLPYYLVTNATAGYLFSYKKHTSSLAFTVNNLFNAEYEVMLNRPSPLRNYQITLKFNIINE